MKKILSILLLFILLFAPSLSAAVPYKTWTASSNGSLIESKTAYTPLYTINDSYEEATDVFYYEGLVYVVDKTLAQVNVYQDGAKIDEIGSGVLVGPHGMYVKKDKIYVADAGANKVVIFDMQGNVIQTIGKPTEVYYGDNKFIPMNIAVDNTGNMFVACEGVSEGLVQFAPDGTFVGFFGGNEIPMTLGKSIQRLFYTDEMEASMPGLTAPTISNVTIDSNGVIYTTTKNGTPEVRKLNIIGTELNTLSAGEYGTNDMFVTEDGFIFTTNDGGQVNVYTPDMELLFGFGSSSSDKEQRGALQSGTAITVDEYKNIYVLDAKGKKVEVYAPTDETLMLYEAINLDSKGMYEESAPLWQELNEANVFSVMPYSALGKNAYKNGEYRQAIEYYKLAFNNQGVSDSFWEIRNDFIQSYLVYFIALVTILFAVFAILKKFVFKDKVKKERLPKVKAFFNFVKLYMLHPAEGVYQIKFKNQVDTKFLVIISTLFVLIVFILSNFSAYIFNVFKHTELLTAPGLFNLTLTFILLFTLLIVSHYLIVSIMEGEGSVSNIIKTTLLSLSPMIILLPLLFIVSYILSLNEDFIYNAIYFIAIVWTLICFIVSVQQLNNFTFKQTIKSIVLTLFTMLIIVIVLFVTAVLIKEVYTFVTDIIMEVLNV